MNLLTSVASFITIGIGTGADSFLQLNSKIARSKKETTRIEYLQEFFITVKFM
jgi:hypothetical protein